MGSCSTGSSPHGLTESPFKDLKVEKILKKGYKETKKALVSGMGGL